MGPYEKKLYMQAQKAYLKLKSSGFFFLENIDKTTIY